MTDRYGRGLWLVVMALLIVMSWPASTSLAEDESILRLVYFTAEDCPHCAAVVKDVLTPLQAEHGQRIQIKMVEISKPANYEMLIRAEELFGVSAEERGVPTLIVDGVVLIGEDDIRAQLPCLLDTCLAQGGTSWPDIPGLEDVGIAGAFEPSFDVGFSSDEVAACGPDEVAACDAPIPVWAAYFYEVGCQNCSRAEYDIKYVQSVYPQLLVEEHNVQDDAALAEWLGEFTGVPEDQRLVTPALFIGADHLVSAEITADSLSALVEKYAASGSVRVWEDMRPEEAERTIVERFRSFGALTVAFAGLVDGLNPCAFATLIFFVSYLTLSGRKGRQVLAVGAAFTLGVFLAYLAVGLGFYQVLDLLGDTLATLGRWVYGLTALLCAVLAVLSLLDALKARRGNMGEMALNLPHALRMRINSVIREGRNSRAFVWGAFFTGIVVSFLELACTGQVYLPTIIFVVSQPEMKARATAFLVLYNLLFILPLVIVFVLAYYGTGSKQLTSFLERRAATVKLGMALLFASLAVWLAVSVLKV